MSFKKRKNKRFDKPKQPIRKDALQMRIDAIMECVNEAKAYVDKAPGYTKEEIIKAVDKALEIENEIDVLVSNLMDIEGRFYEV